MKEGDRIKLIKLPEQEVAKKYLNDVEIKLNTQCEIIELIYIQEKLIQSKVRNISNNLIATFGINFIKEYFIHWNREDRLNSLLSD